MGDEKRPRSTYVDGLCFAKRLMWELATCCSSWAACARGAVAATSQEEDLIGHRLYVSAYI